MQPVYTKHVNVWYDKKEAKQLILFITTKSIKKCPKEVNWTEMDTGR